MVVIARVSRGFGEHRVLSPLKRPDVGVDVPALNLMPGEGGFAEFTVAAPGQYEMLDHHLDHAAAGAAGYLIAGS